MKSWKVPIYYEMQGTVEVEADTMEEAIEIARDDNGAIPLPDNAVYTDGSWNVDCLSTEEMRELYNDGQEDD